MLHEDRKKERGGAGVKRIEEPKKDID